MALGRGVAGSSVNGITVHGECVMRAMLLSQCAPIESQPLRLMDLPIPAPVEGQVLVRVQACAVCRTDLHVIEGDLPRQRLPMIPGHQAVGIVEELGPQARRFGVGDRVGIAWLRSTCGRCRFCVDGNENLCLAARFTGYHEDGGYAEFAVVREDFAYTLPHIARDDAARLTPLLCAGIIGYRALRRAAVKPNSRLGLYGFGSSAHIAIQVAKYWGCQVFVMTRDSRHQALASELGADWAGGAYDKPPLPLDSAILFAPVGELVPPALEALEAGGTLAIAGIHLSDLPSLNYQQHLFREKNLCSVTANTRKDGEELLALATKIPLTAQITPFELADANRALALLKNDAIRGTGVLMMS
jgi:propanol-preferring alcohol dehydrogenase